MGSGAPELWSSAALGGFAGTAHSGQVDRAGATEGPLEGSVTSALMLGEQEEESEEGQERRTSVQRGFLP